MMNNSTLSIMNHKTSHTLKEEGRKEETHVMALHRLRCPTNDPHTSSYCFSAIAYLAVEFMLPPITLLTTLVTVHCNFAAGAGHHGFSSRGAVEALLLQGG